MRRRQFIGLLGGTLAWPFAATAQQTAIPVIGFLSTKAPEDTPHLLAAFRQGLKDTGFVEGQNVAIEYRFASGKVAGAVHVSRGMLEFRADPETPYHDKNFAKDKIVILYCASGGRSALGGKVLKDMGYREVYNLGAFKDWVENGGAVDH
jgi:rhodanese-related sulfurtransferase